MRTVVIMAVALAACRFAADDAAARFRCQESSGCPVGLECRAGWCEEPVPDSLNQNDGSSIELAVKFRTDVIGQVVDGADGSNGVFVLGDGFPDVSTYASSNYWVDPVFEGG